ncbi:hypothetical protein DdX_10782 [Ditylenchus destructor]|uniref:BED-type domain-containing protein n=1 Tax=Ditylenchus destructor TaxID=166010 RepID=A0AAD4MYN0_9BILA|nr:hypothetical protein DdX_10782 [Ditylenchus destructor]
MPRKTANIWTIGLYRRTANKDEAECILCAENGEKKTTVATKDWTTTGLVQHLRTKIPSSLSLISASLPCDVHMVAFCTVSQPTVYPRGGDPSKSSQYPAPPQYKRSAALVLHRFGLECDIQPISRQNFHS